ncbi:MAG: YjjG family noncanonical pyrimidine nucleotidase [Lachnospiraceae bacterium]|nr:YjjG family noncanonical pyrimidine nucleotidase [Lachnospiraceae bacterium]
MKKYEVLLFDVDGTLLDFDKAEAEGIEGLLKHFDVPVTEENKHKYHLTNKRYWEALERGEITRDQVLSLRFEEYFGDFGIQVNGAKVDDLYRQYLNASAVLIDGAIDLLEYLKGKYPLYIVTNGVAETQYNRLAKSGLDKYFDGIFISEEANAQKPQPEFFEYCFEKMGRRDVEHMLIIGDSLTSDMRGGNNAGIDTMWYNPKHEENKTEVHLDYIVTTLAELKDMF